MNIHHYNFMKYIKMLTIYKCTSDNILHLRTGWDRKACLNVQNANYFHLPIIKNVQATVTK